MVERFFRDLTQNRLLINTLNIQITPRGVAYVAHSQPTASDCDRRERR